jgi:hypothetical protein
VTVSDLISKLHEVDDSVPVKIEFEGWTLPIEAVTAYPSHVALEAGGKLIVFTPDDDGDS